MPVRVSKINGKYRVSTPNQTHAFGTTRKQAERQGRLLRAVDHGWHPTEKATREAIHQAAAALAGQLLEMDMDNAPVSKPLERGHVEQTHLDGGHYGKGVASRGKTSGKFKMPGQWSVGHAIKPSL